MRKEKIRKNQKRKIVGKSRVNNGKIGKDMYITKGKHAFGKGKMKRVKGKAKYLKRRKAKSFERVQEKNMSEIYCIRFDESKV